MKIEHTFMMVFRYAPDPSAMPTSEELVEMKQDWGAFIGNLALQEKLESTHQLGFEGKQVFADQSVEDGMSISDNKAISGNMIVRANSLEEASAMAKSCPILKMGGFVEIRNIIPMEN